jgi:MFS transporter, LPLT family, lysophospholipid transporter
MPRTFYLVVAAQFISTLADNALLIVAIARALELADPAWLIPLLKLSFTLSYVVLAPFVGPIADFWRKGQVMLVANVLKALAVAGLLLGVDPLWALAFGGLGAALYAPAKYGLITELLPPAQLVRANGYFEGATVCAVIMGTALGGLLVSTNLQHISVATLASLGWASSPLWAGMLVLVVLYVVSALMALGVKDSGARYPAHPIAPLYLIRSFWQENLVLWRDGMGGLSMGVTTLLWAVGATLQLIVLRWGSEALGLSLGQAAYLQGISAVGVVLGAVLASRHVALAGATRLLPLGVVLGLLVPVMLWVHSVLSAAVLLMSVGAVAGFFVVPMNALLQHRGHQLLTAGRSIAVQGFNENGGILLMLAFYAAATALDTPLHYLIWGFAILGTVTMLLILLGHLRMRAVATPSVAPELS